MSQEAKQKKPANLLFKTSKTDLENTEGPRGAK